jgi:lipoate-protein ligase B
MLLLKLGLVPYGEALDLQRRIFTAKSEGRFADDVLILLQHPPVITLGRQASEHDVLASPDALRQLGVELFNVERGGKATYHGPGQIVGYPILDLRHFRTDVSWFVRAEAEVIIRTLADHGFEGRYDKENPGVWVGGAKIAAFGSRLSNWVTVSLAGLLGRKVAVEDVTPHIVRHFAAVFETTLEEVWREDVEAQLGPHPTPPQPPVRAPVPEHMSAERDGAER